MCTIGARTVPAGDLLSSCETHTLQQPDSAAEDVALQRDPILGTLHPATHNQEAHLPQLVQHVPPIGAVAPADVNDSTFASVPISIRPVPVTRFTRLLGTPDEAMPFASRSKAYGLEEVATLASVMVPSRENIIAQRVPHLQHVLASANSPQSSSDVPLLRLHHVSFRYPSRSKLLILDDFNLTLRKGEVVALVGASGDCECAIIKLLSRLYEPCVGTVELDGRPIAEYEHHWLHGRAVTVLSRDPIVFFGRTVWQQILYALDAPTEETGGGRRALYGPSGGVARPTYVHLGNAKRAMSKPADDSRKTCSRFGAWWLSHAWHHTSCPDTYTDNGDVDLEARLIANPSEDTSTHAVTASSFMPTGTALLWSPAAHVPGLVCYDVHGFDNTGAIIRGAVARMALVAQYTAGLRRARRALTVKRNVLLAQCVASNVAGDGNNGAVEIATAATALAALAPFSTFNIGVPRRSRSILMAASRKRAHTVSHDNAEVAVLSRLSTSDVPNTANARVPDVSNGNTDKGSPGRNAASSTLLVDDTASSADTAAVAAVADSRRLRRKKRLREWVRSEHAARVQGGPDANLGADDDLPELLEAWGGSNCQRKQQRNKQMHNSDAFTDDECSTDDDSSSISSRDDSANDDASNARSDTHGECAGLHKCDARVDLPIPTPTPPVMRRVLLASRSANVIDFVRQLPDGFDTVIGPTGSMLSSDQKQRLALARALARNPAALLIDDGMSGLEAAPEPFTVAGIASVMKDRCVLVFAHRLSTVREASRICVVANGRIVEEGSHDQLVALGGAYSTLVARHFVELPLDNQLECDVSTTTTVREPTHTSY